MCDRKFFFFWNEHFHKFRTIVNKLFELWMLSFDWAKSLLVPEISIKSLDILLVSEGHCCAYKKVNWPIQNKDKLQQGNLCLGFWQDVGKTPNLYGNYGENLPDYTAICVSVLANSLNRIRGHHCHVNMQNLLGISWLSLWLLY